MEVSGELPAPAALPPGNISLSPLNKRQCRSHSRYGAVGEEQVSAPDGNRAPILRLLTVLTELFRLLNHQIVKLLI
jgi:hypothetical protein